MKLQFQASFQIKSISTLYTQINFSSICNMKFYLHRARGICYSAFRATSVVAMIRLFFMSLI